MQQRLTNPAWDDINVSGVSLGAAASAPGLEVLVGNILVRSFDGAATMEQLYGVIEMPHTYKEGTDIELHLHWCPIDAAAGNVKWQVEYTWNNPRTGTVFGAPTSISVISAAAGVAASSTPIDFSPLIVGTGMKISSHFAFRLFRDPTDVADTYGSDAQLIQVGIHYQVDTLGSRLIHTKT